MISRRFYQQATEKLGFRQKAYQAAFGVEGSPANLALVDLADFCNAFVADTALTSEQFTVMLGRRQAFFRIWSHLKLTNTEMEMVCRQALIRAASRIAQVETVGE